MALRGAAGPKRMRSTDSSARVPVVHRLVNAAGAPAQRTTASGNCRRYCAENAPMEKRFSPVDLLASHALDMRCSAGSSGSMRSEEHTSELQSPCNLVCRLLLEKKKNSRRLA